jgi:O-antigen/teichoic acid export membrane protein
MSIKYTSTLIRLSSLLISGFSSILIANFILEISGDTEFARYSLLIGITSLLPFIDFGIGYRINALILDHHSIYNQQIRNDLSRCFTMLVIIWLTLSVSTLLVFQYTRFDLHALIGLESNDQILILAILLLTFANVPLSIGSRILIADGRILIPLVASLAGTTITLAALPIFFNLAPSKTRYLGVIPMLIMVFVNIFVFLYAQKKTEFRVNFVLNSSRTGIFEILSYGLSATLTNSFTPIILQLPKYILGHQGNTREVSQYSLFLLFLQPIIAASTFSLLAVLPDIRRTAAEKGQFRSIVSAYTFSLAVGFVLSIAYLAVSELPIQFPVNFPKQQLCFLLLLLVPFQILRQNLTATFTNRRNLRFFLMTFSATLLIVLIFQQWIHSISAFGAILSIVLFESVLSCAISILFFRRHVQFLTRALS